MKQFEIAWLDSGKEPTCKPDPMYPNGVELDLSMDASKACTVELPYPAPRIGMYRIKCRICKLTAACTTAGRIDDPRSVRLPCKLYEG